MSRYSVNILYVDDEESNLTSFKSAFRHYFNIYTAKSGVEGLQVMQEHTIHIVLTDQRMPDMSGIQFLETVMNEYPNVIRMVLTGYADMNAVIEAINTGRVYSYITKPWDELELKSILDGAARTYFSEIEHREVIDNLQKIIDKQQQTIDLYKQFTPSHLEADILNTTIREIDDGQLRIVSLLYLEFVDAQSIFTKNDPRRALIVYNAWIKFIEKIVISNNGTLVKAMCNKVIAVFGAPVSFLDNPLNCMMCAAKIAKEIESFKQEHHISFKLAIAVHMGDVISGNTEFVRHLDYSVIGETVETGEKLLSLAKTENDGILLSQSMLHALEPYHLKLNISKLHTRTLQGEEISFYLVN